MQYAEYHEMDFDYLWYLIVSIDEAYIDWHTKKRKAELDELERKSKRNKGGSHGRR